MTRSEHVEWCKKRARQYVDNGDIVNAFASMVSDLKNHPETENHAAINLGMAMLMSGQLSSPAQMRRFIEGFN